MSKKTLVFALLVFLVIAPLYFLLVRQNPIELIRWELSKSQEYNYCPCCCRDTVVKACLYKSQGDNAERLVSQANAMDCSKFGCSGTNINYKYCDL